MKTDDTKKKKSTKKKKAVKVEYEPFTHKELGKLKDRALAMLPRDGIPMSDEKRGALVKFANAAVNLQVVIEMEKG